MHASYSLLAVAALLPLSLAAPVANPDVVVTVVRTITKVNGVEVQPKTGNANYKTRHTRIRTTTVQPVVEAAPSQTAVVVPVAPAPAPVTSAEPETTAAAAAAAAPAINVQASSYSDETTFKNDMLAGSNWYRAQHGANPLVWNDTIAAYAQNWANGCNFKHSGGPTGENLAAGASTPLVTADMWGEERTTYNWNAPAFSHFTQLVWKATTSVGCARKACNGANGTPGYMVVCEYYPAGNMMGAGGSTEYFDQNVGKIVSGKLTDKIVV